MAQDGYPPRPTDSPPSYDYSDPRTQYPQSYNPHDAYRPSSRQASRERASRNLPEHIRLNHQQRPIDEAVSTAFDRADTSGLNPDLIAQITQNVIRQLRVSGDSGTPITATQAHYPPPPTQQPYPPSPSSAASPPIPTRNVYTPPSPHRHSEYPSRGSPESRASVSRGSPPTTYRDFEDRRPPSRVSVSSESGNVRPSAPTREPTSKEETPLEKIWGQMFDKDGNATPRLGQLLRGLAVHLIDDYEPKYSLVVTPTKLARFYDRIGRSKEYYPWSDIFDNSQSNISRMYRELECQHHLVQDPMRLNERPDIPGLTPVGFDRWATLMIRAHPEEEFERLQKAVLEMPINNPDDTKERFPKEIPRRLFPTSEDFRIRDRLVSAMEEHCHVNIDTHQSDTPRPPKPETAPPRSFSDAPATSDGPYPRPSIERERKPYSSIPNESAIDDTNPPAAQPIERERKPYRATPGGGRIYEEQDGRTTIPVSSNSTSASVPPHIGIHRANSSSTRSINIPPPPGAPPRQVEGMPDIHQMRHRASVSARRRGHSPSTSLGANDFRRSDTDIRSFELSSSHGTPLSRSQTVHESGDPSGRYDNDGGRRYGREAELRRGDYARGGSPNRKYEPMVQERRQGMAYPEEEYYRNAGRREAGERNW